MSSDPTASEDESSENQSEDGGVTIGEVASSLAKLKGSEQELEHIEQVGAELTDTIAFFRMVGKADLETANVLSNEMTMVLDNAMAEHDEVTFGSVAFAHWLALEKLLLVDEDETECADDETDTETSDDRASATDDGDEDVSASTEKDAIILTGGDEQTGTEIDPAFY